MSREQEATSAIESAVEQILDGYDALASVFDGYADVVTSEQAATTFLFLVNTHNTAQAQVAEVVRQAEEARKPKQKPRRFSLSAPPATTSGPAYNPNPVRAIQPARVETLTEEDEALLARVQAYADEPPAPPKRPTTVEEVRRQRVEQYKRLGGRLSANSPDINPGQPTAPIMGTPGTGAEHMPSGVDFIDE